MRRNVLKSIFFLFANPLAFSYKGTATSGFGSGSSFVVAASSAAEDALVSVSLVAPALTGAFESNFARLVLSSELSAS